MNVFVCERHQLYHEDSFSIIHTQKVAFSLTMPLVHQKNACALPEDLRDFYLTTDGFTLTWSSKLESESPGHFPISANFQPPVHLHV